MNYITYTHRPSDYTQDVYVRGVWIASAENNHTADLLMDYAERGLTDGVPAFLLDDDVPTDNPDDDSDTGTYGPNPLRQPVFCSTCGDDGDCPDCDGRAVLA